MLAADHRASRNEGVSREQWLAPDAVVAGSALALLGDWRGYSAAPGWRTAAGYTLICTSARR